MAKPQVSCCIPVKSKFPSGWRWAHARACPVSPGQRVRTPEELAARGAHPAGKALSSGW